MFIVFDGIDGAGKSTQIELAKGWLAERGCDVCQFFDPGSTVLGKRLREILLNRGDIHVALRAEMLLFMAARAQLVDELVRPALAAGKTVICDRFSFSTVVYQGHAGGLDIDMIWEANRIATGGLVPQLTILFDLPAETALARLQGRGAVPLDNMESRGLAFYEAVRAGFLQEARRCPTGVAVVDADREPEAIQNDVLRLLEKAMSASQKGSAR